MEPPAFRLRPRSGAPVRFFALGLAGFVALGLAVLAWPAAIAVPPGSGGIALLHLAVLGWITPVMLGADAQLLPVVLGRPLPAPRLDPVIWGLYALGVLVFLPGLALGLPGLIATGGVLVGIAVLAFVARAAVALSGLRRLGPEAVGLGGGLAFLALVATLGPLLALGIGAGLPLALGTVLALHAAAGLGGWLLLTIMGATYQLVPFFAGTPPAMGPRFGLGPVLLVALGVLGLLAAALGFLPGPAWPAAVAALGLALWAADLARLIRHGRQARREPVVTYSAAAVFAILLAAGGAVATFFGVPDLAAAAAYLGLVTGPALLIAGQLQKILPFIAALDASVDARRRGQVPRTEAMFPRAAAWRILCVLGPGSVAVVAGLALHQGLVTRVGAAVVLAATVAFAVIQRGVLAVWRRAGQPAPPAGPAPQAAAGRGR